MNALQVKEASGEIDVFYMDESGFSVDGCIPYAWQPQGKTLELPANATGRVNVIGWVSRQGESYFHPVETTVTSSTVAEAMADFIQSRPTDKLTVVIMDNAPAHRKAERENQVAGLLGMSGWAAYTNFQSLRNALQEIFRHYGTEPKYQVNFA